MPYSVSHHKLTQILSAHGLKTGDAGELLIGAGPVPAATIVPSLLTGLRRMAWSKEANVAGARMPAQRR